MFEDMSESEALICIELRIGLSKTFRGKWDPNKIEEIEKQFNFLLHKYKHDFGIKSSFPRIRTWTTDNTVNFMLFDKQTGRRVLLGDWLISKDYSHEQ